MLGGRNKNRPLGYTIVEVMIVLAVSGMMFLIAANFINGKQQRAAFTQGSNDTVSQLQNIVEDVTNGHYSDVPIACQASASSISFPTGSDAQGTHQDCVFLGKIVHFYGPAGQATNYNVFSIAAGRNISGQLSSSTTAVAAITTPGLTTTAAIPQGLYVKSMSVQPVSGSPANNVYNIGFAQGLGTIDAATGTYQTSNQPVSLIYTTGLAATTKGDASSVGGGNILPAVSATMCISDGTRYAQIFVGGASTTSASSNNNNQLSISVQQLGTAAC